MASPERKHDINGFNIGENLFISDHGIAKIFKKETIEIETEPVQKLIDQVKDVVNNLGYSSCSVCGRDDFDNKCTGEDSTCISSVQGSGICGMRFPYDSIQYRDENLWLFACANNYFRINNNLIPYNNNFSLLESNFCFLDKNGDDIKIFKIPRSNGTQCQGIIEPATGLKLHQSKTIKDDRKYIYISFLFNMSGDDIEIIDNKPAVKDYGSKFIKLEKLLACNPEIAFLKVRFTTLGVDTDHKMSLQKESVITHFNTLHNNWWDDEFLPVFKLISNSDIKLLMD